MLKNRIYMSAVIAIIVALLSACGAEDSTETDFVTYDPEDVLMTLTDTKGEEVQLFSSSQKSLYLYFTGVD